MIGIYKITSPTNKVYIGQSIDIEKRFKFYRLGHLKNQVVLKKSFDKHGFESHILEIIEECNIDLLNERERYWQDFYDVLNGGLNCRLTGYSDKKGKLSYSHRLKISKSRMGALNHMYGKKMSDEVRDKISKSHKKNGLMKRGGNHRAKKVLDLEMGIYYDSLKSVSETYDLNYYTLKTRMRSLKKYNRFIYV